MGLSPDGFLAPDVDMEKCANCGQCNIVCSFTDDAIFEQRDKMPEVAAYSGVTKDSETLLNVTSGGVAFELGKICLQNGYSVIGCVYDYAKQMAVHIIANDEKELKLTIGSKYIQSWTDDVLKRIDINKKYAVFGSPCQIDSLRRFTRKNNCEQNWIFIDFFCHGVPSYHLWKKYIDYRTRKNTEVAMVKFRDKKNGWGFYTMTMTMTMTNGKCYSRALNKNDFFLNMFLGNYILNKPCYSCKFHGLKCSADVRVGDFWGKKYADNKAGVSLVIVFSEMGADLLKHIEKDCLITKETIKVGLEGQFSTDLAVPINREKIINELKTQKSLALIYFRYCVKQWRGYFIPGFLKKIIRYILKKERKG
jgi:coenzyme F420-reducing hydrogenase beta subunit